MTEEFLRMKGISKSFPGVKALSEVTFEVRKGEVHALVGENGAGKSTLMKILSGAQMADSGEIEIEGVSVRHSTPEMMLERGIAVIYQELTAAPHLSVAENVFLGRLPRTNPVWIDWRAAEKKCSEIAGRLGFQLDPRARLGSLTVAQQQMVEITKALSRQAKLVVLDEPSAVLGDQELEKLFVAIKALAAEGISFIYISHRLKEVFEIANRVTVLRDGAVVTTRTVAEVTQDQLVNWMVGRDIEDFFPERVAQLGDVALRVIGLCRTGVLDNINFEARTGEILGICGLAGAGRTELLRAIVGADRIERGTIELFGKSVSIRSPRQALGLGIGLVPEDRKRQGLFLNRSVAFNITISNLRQTLDRGVISRKVENRVVTDFISSLRIKTPSAWVRARNLSGGNQQKCVLAKKLNARCKVLLVDEPTRGIDVGAKREIYKLFSQLTAERLAIIMVSSELPEVLGCCDRILVMKAGRIAAEFSRKDASEQAIMRFAA
ncbi:MAG TPA: sugar ABC transporter ATP-binding protein [Chthoniobacterales bacterium]|nr:sugar ABC transporter ATP-binding protein [Chthoniobacterales bacterium]